MPIVAQLSFNGTTVSFPLDKMSFFDDLYVDCKLESTSQYQRLQIEIHPKQQVKLEKLEIRYPFAYQNTSKVFCNGFQSWSESKEYPLDGRILPLRKIAHRHLKYYGDTYLPGVQHQRGWLHSWTYTYIRQGTTIELFGSLNEKTAFTLFQHHPTGNELLISSDVAGLELHHSFPILDIIIVKGAINQVFDTYFATMQIPPPTAPLLSGWTSWYNYYTNISEEIILKNARAFAENDQTIDIIQIDDGYQQKVGDWLNIKSTFPNGMGGSGPASSPTRF